MSEPTSAALNLSPREKLEILGAMLLAMFLFALDQTVVGTALPRIVSALHGSNELYTWSVPIYLLTAVGLGGSFVYRALRLWRDPSDAKAWALFKFSVLYLGALFAAVAIDALV